MVGRDALSNTSCECVVAKANEADCFANAEVEKPERERGGTSILGYTPFNPCDFEMTSSIVRFLIIFAIKIQLPTDLWWGVVFLHI